MPVPVALRVALPMNAFIDLPRAVHRRPAQLGHALDRARRQPDLGGACDVPGLPPVHAPRLHRPGLRRLGPPVRRGRSGPSGRPGRGDDRRSWPRRPAPPARASSRSKLEASLATSFSHLYVLQTEQLHRPAVTEEQLQATAAVRQGRRPGRGHRSGLRLAMRRHLDLARRDRDRQRHLPARRGRRRTVRRRRRRAEGGQRVLPGPHPHGRRPEPTVAVRRLRRPARRRTRKDHHECDPQPRWEARASAASPARRRPSSRRRAGPRRHRRRRLRHDRRLRREPGRHRVRRRACRSRPTRCSSPSASGSSTPYGKFMGSTVSPDGRFLAATANDRSVSLQIFDLSTYKLIWRGGTAAGVNLRLSDNTVGQEGPLYSPDGTHPLDAQRHRPHPVPGQGRRHPGGGHQDRHPDRRTVGRR